MEDQTKKIKNYLKQNPDSTTEDVRAKFGLKTRDDARKHMFRRISIVEIEDYQRLIKKVIR